MTQTITSVQIVDSSGNITLHGRTSLYLTVTFDHDVSATPLFFEVQGKFKKPLALGTANTDRLIILTNADVSQLNTKGLGFILTDESNVVDNTTLPFSIWEGTIYTRGYNTPAPAEANP